MSDPFVTPPEDLDSRVQEYVDKARKHKLKIPAGRVANYARMLIAAEEVIRDRERDQKQIHDEVIRVAALEHGIIEQDPEKARKAYAAACGAQQQVHASATGCSRRLAKLRKLLETRHDSLQVDVAAEFPIERIAAASQVIQAFADATAPHGRWADFKMIKSDLSLPIPGHTFVWWWTRIPSYRGKWHDMFELARCWHLTDSNEVETFRRRVLKLKPRRLELGVPWFLRCPPWAVKEQGHC